MADPANALKTPQIRPVVLSGGSGTRLWPLSRRGRPKQFARILGEESLFQRTLERVGGAPFLAPLVIASARHQELVAAQLAERGLSAAMVLEPSGRNTAAAVAVAALWAERRGDPGEVLAVLPADHHIADKEAFRAALAAAARLAASQNLIVTLGVTPDRPATGYGYIEAGAPLGGGGLALRRFHEKPEAETAARYLESGRFYWNAGIFVARAAGFAAALRAHAPMIWEAAEAAMAEAEENSGAVLLPRDLWARVPAISFDYAVMEKLGEAAVVPVECGWSDVGSFDVLAALMARDAAGNAVTGPVTAEEIRNCLLVSRGPRIVARGLEDVIVIADSDAVLVIPTDEAQGVRALVQRLGRDAPEQL